jgi:flagellar biosynthesis protein FlhG
LVVVCDEPTSLTDAYALIKVLLQEHGVRRFQILANMVRGSGEGRRLFATLEKVTSRFLDVILEYAGEIPLDPQVRLSIREQRPISFSRPDSPAAAALKQLGAHADKWPVPAGPRGHIEFFAERLLRRPPVRLELVR